MNDSVSLVRALIWLTGTLGASLIGVVLFGIRRHLTEQRDQAAAMHALENTAITTTEFNRWTARMDKRIERLEAHFDQQFSQLREDNRQIVGPVLEFIKKS